MEGSGTQCIDSWSRNSGVRERCLQSPGSTQSFSHGRDPRCLMKMRGCFLLLRIQPGDAKPALALLGSSTETLSLNRRHGHYPFGWSEKTINVSQPPRKVVGGTDMKACSYFSKECWEWIVLWWSSNSLIPRKTNRHVHSYRAIRDLSPMVDFSTKGMGWVDEPPSPKLFVLFWENPHSL